ncbi:MAG: hypothetical protein SNJ59_03200 [Aggregatilineales bacterium]
MSHGWHNVRDDGLQEFTEAHVPVVSGEKAEAQGNDDIAEDSAVDAASVSPATVKRSPLQGLRAALSGQAHRQHRRQLLDRAIADFPEVAVNYLLRGELLLQAGDFNGAAADFERALTLASAQFEQAAWGLSAQITRDRAMWGIAETRRRAGRQLG